jgi:hypothetical protein
MAEREQRASEQGATILQEREKKSVTIKIAREILETNLAIDIVISWKKK